RTLVAISTISHSSSGARSDRALERALTAARTAAENRGRDIMILDLRDLTSEFDYFVLVTGSSGRQLRAISEEIDHVLEDQMHDRRLGIEGYQDNRWILLDYGDIIVHLFDADARSYYALDQLWGTAKRIPFDAADAAGNLRRLGS
ncbi:MAG TPA: ribosome silencing factor, partial [Pirellulales bacterium]